MVYIKNWDAFAQACTSLYEAEPVKTRCCIKWTHGPGLLVLKVTDDTKCIKFRTRSSLFLNRFDQLNRSLVLLMHNRRQAASLERPGSSGNDQLAATAASRAAAYASTSAGPLKASETPTENTVVDTSGKAKKKKSKKKK